MKQQTKIALWVSGAILLGSAIAVGVTVLARYRKRVALRAKDYTGIKETANNSGFQNKAFEEMMKSVGWKSSDAWCMYFAKMVWLNVYKKDADVLRTILTGSTIQSYNNAVNDGNKNVIVSKEPKTGDIVIWQNYSNGSAKSTGHAGIVIKKGINTFTTIEGNTSEQGAREGTTVLLKERKYNWNENNGLRLLGFIRKKLK